MPKHKDKPVSVKSAHKKTPYQRDDTATPSLKTSEPSSMEAAVETARPSSSRRRRNSKKKRNGDATPDVGESEPDADAPKRTSKLETADELLTRHRASLVLKDTTNATEAALSKETAHHSQTKRQLREMELKLQRVENKAAEEEKRLRERVAELEGKLEEKAALAATQGLEISNQATIISEHNAHHDTVKEGLSCGVCFEILSDPHVVTCGHTACRKCLIQWFRSDGAYPGITEPISPDDDLTYRTKICHVCRDPVLSRPVRMFQLQSVIETLGLAPRIEDEDRNEDHWKLTFPLHPTSYLLHDQSDYVERCPRCACEVADGECEGCGAAFSVSEVFTDSEMSFSGSEGGFHVDNEDDLPPDALDRLQDEIAALRQAGYNFPEPVDAMFARRVVNDAAHQATHHLDFIDDIADCSENDVSTGASGGIYSESEGNSSHESDVGDIYDGYGEDDRPPRRRRHRSSDPADILRYGAAHTVSSGDESDRPRLFSPPQRIRRGRAIRGTEDLRRDSPPPRRRRGQPEPEEMSEADSYESSFIDDDIDDEAAVEDLSQVSDVSEQPTMSQLRQRRAAHFGQRRSLSPIRSPSPVPLPAQPARRATRGRATRGRATRARRIIEVSDDE